MLVLRYQSLSICVVNDPTYSFGSNDNVRTYDRETCIEGNGYRHNSAHGVTVAADNDTVASHLIAAAEGLTGVCDNSAVILPGKCVMAVGGYLVSLSLPSLDIEWSRKVDWAAVFGVHISCDEQFLLAHGELSVSRLDFNGDVVWESGGTDIFSEGFQVHESHVSAVDFGGRAYRFDLDTGEVLSVSDRGASND